MKKTLIAVLCAFAVVAAALPLGRSDYSRTEYMMDTVITIKAYDKKAVDACFDEIERLEKLLSVYAEGSDVSQLNSNGSHTISPETAYVLEKANEYKMLTDGAFDISVKPVSDLWDIKGGGYVPTDAEIAHALSLKGDVSINGNTAILSNDGMQIDLGGIAKGYVGDVVRNVLVSHGVESAIVDLGGNIVAVGHNRNNKKARPWRVGLQDPKKPRGTTFAEIDVADKVVVTSGGYERFFEKNGKKYHHIIDPATGKNPENDILSVTIVADDGILADALSTACFVKGSIDGMQLAEKAGADAVVYTAEGIFYTRGMADIIHVE